jgi:hypothetical protein
MPTLHPPRSYMASNKPSLARKIYYLPPTFYYFGSNTCAFLIPPSYFGSTKAYLRSTLYYFRCTVSYLTYTFYYLGGTALGIHQTFYSAPATRISPRRGTESPGACATRLEPVMTGAAAEADSPVSSIALLDGTPRRLGRVIASDLLAISSMLIGMR